MTTLLATDALVMAIGGGVRPQLCCITPIVRGGGSVRLIVCG